MTLPNFAQLPDFSVRVGDKPPQLEGNRAVPVNFDFTAVQSYNFDFQMLVQQKKISFVQTVYIDNSLNSQPSYMLIGTTNQLIIAPPLSQGYYNCLISGPAKMTLSTTGAVIVPVQFMNFEVDALVWYIGGTGNVVNGNLQVQDVILESAVSNGFMNSLNNNMASSSVVKPNWKGDKTFSVNTAATGPTTLIAAQGAGFGWFVDNLSIDVSADASLAAAGELTVTVTDTGTGTVFSNILSLPNAAGTGLGKMPVLDMKGIGYNAKTANNTFTITLSAALATGKIVANGTWGITNIIG